MPSKPKTKPAVTTAVTWLKTIRDRNAGTALYRPAAAAKKALGALATGNADEAVAWAMVAAAGDATVQLVKAYRPAALAVDHQGKMMLVMQEKKADNTSARYDDIAAEFLRRRRARGNRRKPTDTDIINAMHDAGQGAIGTIRKATERIRVNSGGS